MPMFRVHLTRLVEQECSIYVRAATISEAQDKAKAVEEYNDITLSVWADTACDIAYTAVATPMAPDTVQTPAERPQDAVPTTQELRD